MSDVPEEVRFLLDERERARASKDYARADEIRDEIASLGYDVRDGPQGPTVEQRPTYVRVDPAAIESLLEKPPAVGFSINLLHEGYVSDVERFLAGLARHAGRQDLEVILVDNASDDAEALEALASERVRVVHLNRRLGYAQARNAGLKSSRGRLVVLADLSVEPVGDVLGPLDEAFSDSSVGVAGPWGIVSEDLREFTESQGPEVDAIEGYFLATRRELLAKGLIHERFRWYRHADIDMSFQVRALGTRAVVVPVPLAKHTHRGWSSIGDQERSKWSKRNWGILFDRWKHRHDLLLSHRE